MRFLTRLMLLAIAFAICAPAGFGQEAKPKPDGPAATPSPATPPIENDPNGWRIFFSPAGFSVMFPGTSVQESDGSSDTLAGRKYMLTTTAVYVVTYLDLPDSFTYNLETETALRNQMFDGARDLAVKQVGGKVISETEISLDSHPGRLLKFSVPNGTVLRQKSYVVGKRMYQVMVVTSKELLAPDGGKFDESRATKFLDSFKLGKPVAVEENPQAWKAYSSASGRFSVLFPGTPTSSDHSYDTEFGRCDAEAYTVTSAEYVVSYTDFVIELEGDAAKFEETLNSIRDSSVAKVQGKILDETATSVAGHKGRLIRLASTDQSVTTVKAFAVAKRLYLLIVTTPAETPNSIVVSEALVKKFFDSFKIVSK